MYCKSASQKRQHLQCEKHVFPLFFRKTAIFADEKELVAMKSTVIERDCKSPRSTPANCKFAGTEHDTLLRRVMAPYPLRINRNRLDTLYSLTQPDTTAELTYFFHPDHLGSASWITDLSGQPVQHLQYKPFGGDYIDQQDPNTEYSERFRFTGKERDAETGYDYFGARYYSSSLGIWLSVDPMSDKYPSLSPYVYCADNPMRLVDLEGCKWDSAAIIFVEKYKEEVNLRIGYINDLREKNNSTERLDLQFDEYNKILGELNDLGNDPNNIYRITKGVDLGKNVQGKVSYGGKKDDLNIIQIDLASKDSNIAFYLDPLAHDLKHAYQYFEGRLGFALDENGKQTPSNTKELEKEAHVRGRLFKGKTMINNNSFKTKHNINSPLTLDNRYKVLPEGGNNAPQQYIRLWEGQGYSHFIFNKRQ